MRKYGMEPWNAVEVTRDEDELIQIRASNGGIIARLWIDVDDREFSDEQRENARRIVACVNACRGLPTDELEQKWFLAAVGTLLLEADQQRDELLAEKKDHQRLVRELDVLLNGVDGAAHQASLCDLVAQLKSKGGAA